MGKLRIHAARAMIRAGSLIQSLAIAVMRTDDLVEYSRRTYDQPGQVAAWGSEEFVANGLNEVEKELLDRSSVRAGKLLLLGIGGGREALALADRDFSVTGVDFVPTMVERALENARKRGVALEGLAMEATSLKLPENEYALVWFSPRQYSVTPTRKRRVALLRKLHASLRPAGCVICQFHWDPARSHSSRSLALHRILAWITCGYLGYEPGDMLWRQGEFLHAFSKRKELMREFTAAGFVVEHLETHDEGVAGAAILRKPKEPA